MEKQIVNEEAKKNDQTQLKTTSDGGSMTRSRAAEEA